MNMVDKTLLLNKIKDMSIQNKIINNIKTTAEIAIIESDQPKLILPNIPPFLESLEKYDAQKIIEDVIIKLPIPEPIVLSQEILQTSISPETIDINSIPEPIITSQETLDINEIIEKIKEPIALLEKYLLTNSIPININQDELKNYINIYKTIVSLKDLDDLKKLSEYGEKTSCFTAIKNIFSKNRKKS
jgi:hypothetical protein